MTDYRTTDLVLATYLLTLKLPYFISISPTNKAIFVFENSSASFHDAIEDYTNGTASINIIEYEKTRRFLTRIIREMKKNG